MEINDEKNIPIINFDVDNDKPEDLNNAMQYCFKVIQGSSAYSNNRDREYNGQPHTDNGERGKTLVAGLTMRDIKDCIVQGMLKASGDNELRKKVFEIHDDMKGTEYEDKGNWLHDDIYKIDFSNVDPGAIIQCTMCFIEHYMGIFPNVPKLNYINKELFDENK